MTSSTDELEIEVDAGQVRFRLDDGTLLGAGTEAVVVPAIRAAFARLDEPQDVVDGVAVRPVCTLDLTGTDLVLGRTEDGMALIFRDEAGSVTGRVDLAGETADAFLTWLGTESDAQPAPPEGPARRTQLLEAIEDVTIARRGAEALGASSDEIRVLTARIQDLRRRYVENLPQRAVARDPFHGALVTVALDDGGLDGPFWDAQNPARPAETMPPSFVVLTGAMRLSRLHVEHTSHLCLPGPRAPFVVPDLLGREGVKAVLSTVPVGPHTGYAISYFTPREAEPPPLPNEWGRREYWLREAGRPTTMSGSFDTDPSPDFDLRPWIEASKLAWVAPGDDTMRLRWALPGCPYLVTRTPSPHQRVQLGQIF